MRLSKKSAHRIIVSAGLIAPIVYLFGSLFFALNGAHNGIDFADEPSLYQGITYEEAMTPEKFSYDLFVWDNDYGHRVGFSLGSLDVVDWADEAYFNLNDSFGVGIDSSNNPWTSSINYGLGFLTEPLFDFCVAPDYWFAEDTGVSSYEKIYFPLIVENRFQVDSVLITYYASVLIVDNNGGVSTTLFYSCEYEPAVSRWYPWVSHESFDIPYDLNVRFYFDDGGQIGNGFTLPDELTPYFVPTLKPIETTSKSNYLFGQFFAKDNFLKQWGENVLSDNPVGFAPFATFIKFFDSSLIHGVGSQIALMMYGQLYYMLHIMLFDLVYHVLVFIPNLITSVFNKFGGGLNDE